MKIAIYSIIVCQMLVNPLTTVAESEGNRSNTQENRQESFNDKIGYPTPEDAGYKPPSDETQRQNIEFQGKRGGTEKILKLKVLAPSDHQGQTLKSRPEFWIDMESIPQYPLQINLIAKKGAISVWREDLNPKSNLFALKYPESLPPLEPGVYILAVGYKCPDSCQSLRMSFVIVEDENLIKELQNTISVEQKIKLLAEKGFWFDAQSLLINQLAEKY